MSVDINPLPKITLASSSSGDDAVVRQETNMDDINKTLKKTDKANPAGAVVRCTEDGNAVYNDADHQCVFSPDGRITVLDRDSMGGQSLKVNLTIKDGLITYHNPDPKGPKYLTCPVPSEGMELTLSGGTTLYVQRNDDGTYDAHITNVQTNIPGAQVEPTAGFLANFRGLGTGKPFVSAANADGATTGGNRFHDNWDITHPRSTDNNHGGKNGDWHQVIVASMFSDGTWQDIRRASGHGTNELLDPGQAAGGLSVRSDKTYDTDDGWRFIWHDLADASVSFAGRPPDNPADSTDILSKGDSGAQAFANPNDPQGADTAIFGKGVIAGSSADNATAGSSADPSTNTASAPTREPNNSSSSAGVNFLDYLASSVDYDTLARKKAEQGQ